MIENFIWIIFALLSALTAALVTILGKIGLSNVDPVLATTIRAIIMAIFLVLVSLALGKFQLIKAIETNFLFFIVLSGIFGALSWLFYFIALKYGVTSIVAAIDRLSIVFILIFSVLFLAESLSFKIIFGIILIVIGSILLVI